MLSWEAGSESVGKMRWHGLVVLCLLSACCAIELKTKKGNIQGTEETSRSGRKYYSFRGIPYAQPPIGKLRFRNPQSHNGWKGILDATEESPTCIQKYIFVPAVRNTTFGVEDCLYIDIHTPTTDTSKNLPVLVYVHGGGFRCGKIGPREAPAFLMDEDVVLVMVHYRLGALGFLSTEDRLIPGNFGLKDQAMAIKWLSENVHDYGGNPDSIVVFGESAGGASAHYLITSPLSRDFLKGGISQSGVINDVWALSHPGNAKKIAEQVIDIVGCSSSPLLECLQSVDAETLQASELALLEWDFDPAVVFQPVVEEENEGAFMTENPLNIRSTLPWITGYSSGEGILKTASLINQDDSVLDDFVRNIDTLLPTVLFLKPGQKGLDRLIADVKDRFFRNLSDRKQVMDQLENLYFELFFVYPMIQALQKHAGPKYAFILNHRAESSIADKMGPKMLNSPKPCHADELLSLFDWSSEFPQTKASAEDRKVSEIFVKTWVKFAKNRNPNLEDKGIKWDQYSNNNLLNIQTKDVKMEKILLDEIVDFWKRAYSYLEPTTYDQLKEEL